MLDNYDKVPSLIVQYCTAIDPEIKWQNESKCSLATSKF